MTDRVTPTAPPQITCRGLLFVLVGPSGAGKNTIMGEVLRAVPEIRQMPTATTRAMRTGEQHGVQHFFVSGEEFQRMLAAGELVEHQEVLPGRFYGTMRREIEVALFAQHEMRIADIEIYGAQALKSAFPQNVVTIFIEPPTFEALEARIRARGGASEQEIQERLERARVELRYAEQTDYRVRNDDLDVAAHAVIELVRHVAIDAGCL